MPSAIVNLNGIGVRLEFYREGRLWQPDAASAYVADSDGEIVATLDDIDTIGTRHPRYGWVSLRYLAQEVADENTDQWDRDERIADAERERAA